ncbi:MAG: hypothetical protein ACKO1L_07770 [Brachymonas sp.]
MTWLKTAAESFRDVLSKPADLESSAEQHDQVTQIKYAMISILGERGVARFPLVRRRIVLATDVQDLWYLRVDLLSAIVSLQGSTIANAHLRQLNAMFEGLIPTAMKPRNSQLGKP